MATDTLVWFRNDLRVGDNPALRAAMATGGQVQALYVDEIDPRLRKRGAASRWWLNRSLQSLSANLAGLGVRLTVQQGCAEDVVPDVVQELGCETVFWNRRYGPAEREIDTAIKQALIAEGVAATSLPGDVLVEPFDLSTGTGRPYSVYSPFWKALRQRDIAAPLPRPDGTGAIDATEVDRNAVMPPWSQKLKEHWSVGEDAAQQVLTQFLDDLVGDYPASRDYPARAATSRLSPHLAFGEISPRQVWHSAQAVAQHVPETAGAIDKFLSELGWRDFHHHQLYHRADIARVPMVAKYEELPWRDDAAGFRAWTGGRTGFPIIDAGMRELWATGTMHNRVRMLVASLLTKNLLIDWRRGEQWFWDTLVDADAASNPGNWQWVAGSGLDAAPYFRIFNPVTQGERFDASGTYVRRWVPELARLPDNWIQKPFAAPAEILSGAAIDLGVTYPHPIVDLKTSRQRALATLAAL